MNESEKNSSQDEFGFRSDKEAAKYLGVSQVTLWRLRRDGRIGYRRLRGRVVYAPQDIEAFIQSTARGAAAVAAAA